MRTLRSQLPIWSGSAIAAIFLVRAVPIYRDKSMDRVTTALEEIIRAQADILDTPLAVARQHGGSHIIGVDVERTDG